MPYSPWLLVALLVGCGALQASFNLHQGADPALIAAALLAALAVIGVVFLLLRAGRKSERFVQTATGLAAVYLLFGIVTDGLALLLPLKALGEEILAHPEQPPALSGAQILVLLVIFVLGVWQLCVWIRVLRRALDATLAAAVLVFLLLLVVDWIILRLAVAVIGVT